MTKTDLGTFDGCPVVATGAKITGAGDGLSKALGLKPQLLKSGELVDVVVRCRVGHHLMEPGEGGKDDVDVGEFRRIEQLKAITATIIDNAVVTKALDQQATALRKAEEEAKGIQQLPEIGDDGVAETPPAAPTSIKDAAAKKSKAAAKKAAAKK